MSAVNNALPGDFESLKQASDDSFNMKVPPSRKVSFGSAIGFILASIFFMLFFIAISQFYGLVVAYITAAFAIFGWDPVLTALFMSLFFLFLGVTIYVSSKRGNEAVSKMDAGLRIMFRVPPTRFYDLSEIPTENILREMVGVNNPRSKDRGRGCNLEPLNDGKGFSMKCETVPSTRAMELLKQGKLDVMEMKQKAIIVSVFLVMIVLLGISTYAGLLSGIAMWIVWIVFLVAFFYIMVETRVFKAWTIIAAWFGFNIFFTFFTTDPYFLWTMWGGWACGFILVGIFYVSFKDSCVKKKSWYCEFL